MNRLVITVTEFRNIGGSNFGFTASDDYAKTFEDGFTSLKEFYEAYPTEQALIDDLLSRDGFNDIDVSSEFGSTNVVVDGFNPESANV